MRKALIPMLASLALCGAGTTALVMSSAHAQPAAKPPMMLAQNNAPPPIGRDFNGGRNFNGRRAPADMAARLKEMCDNSVARETGRLAYLETRLDLTASEQPLFQRWKTAVLGVAKGRADRCNTQLTQRLAERQQSQQQTPGPAQEGQSGPGGRNAPRGSRAADRPDPAERMAREEDRLKQRLADIEAERPALEALTNALSPTQKDEFTRAADARGNMARGMMRNRFAQGPMRRPMGPGPMGPGQMGPPGPMGGQPL